MHNAFVYKLFIKSNKSHYFSVKIKCLLYLKYIFLCELHSYYDILNYFFVKYGSIDLSNCILVGLFA